MHFLLCYITVEGEPDCGKQKKGQTQDTETNHTFVVKCIHSLIVFAIMVMEINTERMNYKMYSAMDSMQNCINKGLTKGSTHSYPAVICQAMQE